MQPLCLLISRKYHCSGILTGLFEQWQYNFAPALIDFWMGISQLFNIDSEILDSVHLFVFAGGNCAFKGSYWCSFVGLIELVLLGPNKLIQKMACLLCFAGFWVNEHRFVVVVVKGLFPGLVYRFQEDLGANWLVWVDISEWILDSLAVEHRTSLQRVIIQDICRWLKPILVNEYTLSSWTFSLRLRAADSWGSIW